MANLEDANCDLKLGRNQKTAVCFYEPGVSMLASVLRSEKAIQINIQIVRAFIVLRQYALGYSELNQKLENFMIEMNMQFNDIYQALTEMADLKETKKVAKFHWIPEGMTSDPFGVGLCKRYMGNKAKC